MLKHSLLQAQFLRLLHPRRQGGGAACFFCTRSDGVKNEQWPGFDQTVFLAGSTVTTPARPGSKQARVGSEEMPRKKAKAEVPVKALVVLGVITAVPSQGTVPQIGGKHEGEAGARYWQPSGHRIWRPRVRGTRTSPLSPWRCLAGGLLGWTALR